VVTRNGYGHMVLDYYVQRVRELNRERAERLRAVETPEQALAYRAYVRQAIRAAFSPQPPRTPLDARVTGRVEKAEYWIEKLAFESRPGCLVTANLYVPRELAGRAPCVLGTCGHAEPGKAADLYQGFCQRLVRCGFVVLIYDPFSQGERDQYHGLPERDAIGWGTRAHNMAGKQLDLLGDFFGMWRAWDGIRALDYLLERPEVDPTCVGLTGNSGGGTMTTWLWAIEERFTMAAPSCFVTTFLRNLENELPGDAEQCPPGVLGAGLEMADFIIAGAPKPVLLLGQQYDYFDRRGLCEAYEDVRRLYHVLGALEGRVELFIGPQGHGFSEHNQSAMVSFFCRHAGLDPVNVPEVEVLPEDVLYVVPDGQVLSAGATPIHALIAEQARQVVAKRPCRTPRAITRELAKLLSLPEQRSTARYRNLRPVRRGEYVCARMAVETEGNVRAILWRRLAEPAHPHSLDVEPEVRLYLPHVSAEDDLSEEPMVAEIASPLYLLDVRGLGESLPDEEVPGVAQSYGMDYMFHAYGEMLGESYLGRRVYDVLCTIDLLTRQGVQAVHLYGRGQGAILAVFAALWHDSIASLALKNGPRSFFEWTQVPLVTWPAASFCRGLLHVCDVEDCLDVLRARLGPDAVRIHDPWGPEMALAEKHGTLDLTGSGR